MQLSSVFSKLLKCVCCKRTYLVRVERGLDAVGEVIVPDQGVDLLPQSPVPAESLVGVHRVPPDGKPLVLPEKWKSLLCTQYQIHLWDIQIRSRGRAKSVIETHTYTQYSITV